MKQCSVKTKHCNRVIVSALKISPAEKGFGFVSARNNGSLQCPQYNINLERKNATLKK